MSDKFGLKSDVMPQILDVIKRSPKVEKVLIYGSRAMGNYRAESDIDLTLVAPQMSLSELMKIENEIDDLLLPYKIDLSIFHMLDNEELKQHIHRVGIEI